eukprot:TRINITY_DN536_c0_g1_i9.p1 TRINITY_DN536_c0_g1~~TRINITY_DN536_c0_g1_i9.p1  ORF type:complete len:307 (-),score=61.06 TRINITY_DN536_c0_g1_i9:1119-2039(-)
MSAPSVAQSVEDQQIPTHSHAATEPESQFVFLCKLDYARIMANLLQALNWRKDQFLTIQATPMGIKFIVEDGKCLQVSTYLSDRFFQDYKFWPSPETYGEHVEFRVLFSVMIECLNVFTSTGSSGPIGTPVVLQMAYAGHGQSLLLMLEENEVITDCAIRTIEAEPLLNFNFRSPNLPNKVVMQSDKLRDAMNELDWSATLLEFTLSPEFPSFRMCTDGAAGSCEVVYPKESEVFESFESTEGQTYMYRLASIQPIVKAMAISKKTLIRINEDGLLSFQLLVLHDTGQKSFIDFCTLPQCAESMEY